MSTTKKSRLPNFPRLSLVTILLLHVLLVKSLDWFSALERAQLPNLIKSKNFNRSFVLAISLLVATLNPVQVLLAQAQQSIALTMKARAMNAQNESKSAEAEAYYKMALEEARKGSQKLLLVELLARTIRIMVDNHRLTQTKPYVDEALSTIQKSIGTKNFNSEMYVWADDIGDAFMSRGEYTANVSAKEFCLARYLEIELPTAQRYSQQLIGNCHLLTTYYFCTGQFSKAIPYVRLGAEYLAKFPPPGLKIEEVANMQLPIMYLGARLPEDAQSAVSTWLAANERSNKNPEFEAIYLRSMGIVRFEQRQFEASHDFFKRALD